MSGSTAHDRVGGPVCADEARAAELDLHFRSSFRVLWLIAVGIVREPSLAEDIVQEAALIAMDKLDHYQPGTNFAAWAGQIVRNVALNRARSEHRRRAAGLRAAPPHRLEECANQPTEMPGQHRGDSIEQAEFNRVVREALADIAEVPRACLLLRTIEGLGYAEISRLLDIPEGTAMSHVHRTRQALRQRLGPTWADQEKGSQ